MHMKAAERKSKKQAGWVQGATTSAKKRKSRDPGIEARKKAKPSCDNLQSKKKLKEDNPVHMSLPLSHT